MFIENVKFQLLTTFKIHDFYRDIDKIKAGIGEQASHFLNTTLTTIFCIFTAFAFGWQLTLIVITYLPIVFTLNYVVGKVGSFLSLAQKSSNLNLLHWSKFSKFAFYFFLLCSVSSRFIYKRAQCTRDSSKCRGGGAPWYPNRVCIWW